MIRAAVFSYELDHEYVVELVLPTVDHRTLEACVTGRHVVVTGGVEADPEFFGKSDRTSTAFRREIDLPHFVDADHVTASSFDNVLELRAPKLPQPRPRSLLIRHDRSRVRA